ncbi:BamA/TamA family outer membrane protein [Taibaiella sp. KBW10]|uniref:BamA/TamA family outer membrane protein n=1 Tax=Taibaiella sp. KBW10 TaxID=2153357 RepID=UPI000F5907DE|nr:BamA/TamA family outer membrane protein [Taibaiella sp. KBW10]
MNNIYTIRLRFLLILLGLCLAGSAWAQTPGAPILSITVTDKAKHKLPPYKKFDRKESVSAYLQTELIALHKQGYLEASVDELLQQQDTFYAKVHIGAVYKIGKISLQSVPKTILNNAGIVERDYENKVLSPQRIGTLMERLLTYADNNGFPFAYIGLDSTYIDSNHTFNAVMRFLQGPYITIDSIKVFGNTSVENQFLQSYLGIRQNKPYNESALRGISKKIQELPFLKEVRPWEMYFSVDKNNLNLYLNDKNANQINALIGLQPNSQEAKRFVWTADVLLLLNNTFGYGETFNVTYKNLQVRSPQFNAGLIVPYILGSNIALDGKFEYFGRDTLFRRTSYELGARYMFNAKDYLRLSFQLYNNRIQNPDTAYVRANKTLNNNVDLNTRGFSADFVLNRTNYIQNPTKGWAANVSIAGLKRNVLKNDAILSLTDGFDYNSLYEEANKTSFQYRINGNLQFFIPLAKLLAIKTAYDGAYISGNKLYQNELYQIGGFRLLRGFDERSIYANQYHLMTIELRALLSAQSYFFVFGDGGKTYTQYNLVHTSNTPLSFGTGLTLENKSGIFNIVLALGKQEGEHFQFRNAKIHFGYVTYF